MKSDEVLKLDTLSEADLEPVLELFQGGDPDAVARKAGMAKARLLQIRDDLLGQAARERAEASGGPSKKIGRNAPCPCGSGKKYKHCCLDRDRANPTARTGARGKAAAAGTAEAARLIRRIEKTFGLLSAGRFTEAKNRASKLIEKYPNEDRLHDILATSHLHAGNPETAVDICRRRLAVAEMEKAYFIEHGRYRDAEIDAPTLSYTYPPLTWLQKYWIALKAEEYQARYPKRVNSAIAEDVLALQGADDAQRFPAKHTRGLELRRRGLKDTLDRLKAVGPEAIPYLRPLAVRYSWAGLLVPEILAVYSTDAAIRALIDISMFGFAYASGASLHFLEKRGESVIAAIQSAFSRDSEFDPIKTGLVAVLGNIRVPASFRLLLTLLEHDSAHIVNWAGDALAKFKRIDVLPAMMAAGQRIGGQPMIEAAILRLKDLESDRAEFDFRIR
jgi:hypothetical protein